MKRKVLLISLVLVMVLGLSGVSALNFEDLGQTSSSATDGLKPKEIAAGGYYTCVLKEDGNVHCEDPLNSFGSTGGDVIDIAVNYDGGYFLKEDGTVDGGYFPDVSSNVTDVGAGTAYNIDYSPDSADADSSECIITENDNAFCNGHSRNYAGEGGASPEGSLNGYSPASGSLKQVTVGGRISCVLEENPTLSGYLNNVRCFGESTCSNPSNICSSGVQEGVGNYTKGDAEQISAGDGYFCVLKDNSNGNGGNVECLGNSSGRDEIFNYTNGDAEKVEVGYDHTCILKSNGNVECRGVDDSGETADYTNGDAVDLSLGLDHTCVLKQSGEVGCWGDNSAVNSGNYSYNNPPQYSGFSVTPTSFNGDNVTVESSIGWSDYENSFNTSYLEHNFSGSPQNVTTSQNSHVYSEDLDEGIYYVKFYGEDDAGKTNSTGKKTFRIYEGPSFHWEDSSGNQVSGVDITEGDQTVTMVADYSSPVDNAESHFIVYEEGTTNILAKISDVDVVGQNSQGPTATTNLEINQSLIGQMSAPYNLQFNVSNILVAPGSNTPGVSINTDSGSAKVPFMYMNASSSLNIINDSSVSCEGSGYNCTASVSACTDQGGSLVSGPSCSSSSSGSVCCDLPQDPDPKICETITACTNYTSQSNCEQNSCKISHGNVDGCEGSNCGCSWNASESKCYFSKDNSQDPNSPDDGTCFFADSSSGSCSAEGYLNYSWSVEKYKNSSGTYGSQVASSYCDSGWDVSTCPSTAELPGENGWTIPLTIVALVGIYAAFYSRRKTDE